MAETGVSRSTIKRAMGNLVADGHIKYKLDGKEILLRSATPDDADMLIYYLRKYQTQNLSPVEEEYLESIYPQHSEEKRRAVK